MCIRTHPREQCETKSQENWGKQKSQGRRGCKITKPRVRLPVGRPAQRGPEIGLSVDQQFSSQDHSVQSERVILQKLNFPEYRGLREVSLQSFISQKGHSVMLRIMSLRTPLDRNNSKIHEAASPGAHGTGRRRDAKHSSAEGKQRGPGTQPWTLQAQSKDKSDTMPSVGLLHLGSLNGLQRA